MEPAGPPIILQSAFNLNARTSLRCRVSRLSVTREQVDMYGARGILIRYELAEPSCLHSDALCLSLLPLSLQCAMFKSCIRVRAYRERDYTLGFPLEATLPFSLLLFFIITVLN